MPTSKLASLCIFCGASPGTNPRHQEVAAAVGRQAAAEGRRIVYGGGRVGLMGQLADAALAAGGEVIGVMPRALWDREIGHTGLTRIEVVSTMHERKAMMAELSDAFIALPGGCGTLEEFFEVLTWGLLGIHSKPVGVLNVAGYYDPLVTLIDHMVDQGFLQERFRQVVIVSDNFKELLAGMEAWQPPAVKKWVDLAES